MADDVNDDTEARKHIRALIHAWNCDAITGCDMQIIADAAQAYLDAEPAVLTVEGGGDEPYTSILRATGKSTVSQSIKLLAAIDRCGSIGEWKRLGAGRAWIADYERDVALLTSELADLRSQLAKQSEEMAGMRRAVLEEAAKIIEDGIEVCSASGSYMGKRRGGDVNGLFYAKAIRALIDPKTGEG